MQSSICTSHRRARMNKHLLSGSVAALALAITPYAAAAQEQLASTASAAQATSAEQDAQTNTQDDVNNDIIITGSSIRGVAPVGSALIGVSRDTINQTAPANTKELLAYVPQLGNFGANAELSTPDRHRTAGFQPNIHNVGIYATLTLFNGHRFAPVGGEAVFPDPSIIPTIALQRVEVVADGASSIYGSDAVAGVVNFIYRRKVDGIEAQSTIGFNDTRYRKYNAALIGGHSWSSGNIMAAYEYSENRSPLNTEISTLAVGGDQRARGGRDLRASNCLQPNVTVGGVTYAYPTYQVGRNFCGILDPATVIPDSHRHAVLVTARQQVGDRVELWTELNYSKYNTRSFGGQSSLNVFIPSTNPYYQKPPGVVGTPTVQVIRSGIGLFPSQYSTQSSEVMGATFGADVKLGGDWQGTVQFHASKTNDYNSDPELDLVEAEIAANGTTLATALNPFGQAADNNPAVLARINNLYRRINSSSQRLRDLQVKADGPLFAIGGGDVRAAFGIDIRNEQAIQKQFSGSPARRIINVRNDNIGRTVIAGFGEVNVPIVSDENASTLMRKLTLSLAGRYDYYEKYGGRFNPKIGLVWSPFDGLSAHGSYGTSFVAPNLGLITSKFAYLGSRNQNTLITDWKTGQDITRPFNIYNMGGGNPDLKPETATTWSLGLDLNPAQVPGLRFGITYYNIEYRNTIYKASLTDAITNPAFESYRTIYPTAAELAAAMAEAPPEMEVPSYVRWDVIFRSYAVNLGVRKFQGLDFDASYAFNSGFGDFNLSVNANRKLVDKQQVLPGTPFNDRLGTDQAVKWKGRAAIGWSYEDLGLAFGTNYVGSYRYNNGSGFKRADSWTVFDLTINYNLSKIRDGLSIQGRAVNLTNKDAPFVDLTNGYLPGLASPFGRQFEVTVRTKF